MGDPVNSAPCRRCGDPGRVIACDPCLDLALAQADEYRAQFEAMIAAGVSNADANRHLIAVIERRMAAPS